MKKWSIMLAGLLFATMAVAQKPASFQEGTHYHWAAPGQASETIEVAEFFWYGCPHCYSFEPFVQEWLERKPEDVQFVKIPATFNKPNVLMHAQTFYALEMMGVPEQIHMDIMAEMHDRRNPLATQEEMEAFLETKGIDIGAFQEAMTSFAVHVKMKQAQQLAQRYGIGGVPALVVGGQYRNGKLRSYEQMIELLDYLIPQVRGAGNGGS